MLAACDFAGASGGTGCGDGCIRIHQGDYTFPVKRIVQDSLRVRVTQGGMDFLTERVKALVLTFFDADADGNAVIALSDLGLGDIGTSLGPFAGAVENLVVSLDLNSLSVQLIPGSSPAQLRIQAQDVEVGIVSGQVTGSYDGILLDGDAECQLANGSSGHVALLSFELVLSLDTDPGGIVTIDVASLVVDTQDIDVDISSDCSVAACSDGLPPQCSECTILCGAASLGSSLVSFLQNIFDGLIDDLVSFLADDIANLLLDLLFNGQPLAVEGTVDYGPTLAPLLSYLATAEPLGIVGRPGAEAFVITGTGLDTGLDVTMDAGVETSATHPCVGAVDFEPVFKAGPPPTFPLTLPDGSSYEVGLAMSEALINETVWALYRGGALCIDATSGELNEISGGSLDLRAGVMDLMLPGLAELAGPDAPLRVRMRPTLTDAQPDLVGFGSVDGETRLELTLPQAQIAIEVLYADHYLRAIAFRADVTLSVALDALPDASIALRVADIGIANTTVENDAIFGSARMDLIVPFMVDILTGFIGDIPIAFNVPTAGLASGTLGLPLDVVVRDIVAAGSQQDWLVAYVGLVPPIEALEALEAPPILVTAVLPGQLRFSAPLAASDEQFQLRIGAGSWSKWFVGPGPHVLKHPRLWLLGKHIVAGRARPSRTATAGETAEVAAVDVVAPTKAARQPLEDSESGDGGCASSGGSSGDWPLVLCALLGLWLSFGRRSGALGAAAVTCLATFGGCATDLEPPPIECRYHDECPGGWMCGLEGVCEAEVACVADSDCCPGATCFNDWCRPTSFCDLSPADNGSDSRGCLAPATTCEIPWPASPELLVAPAAPGMDGGWCAPSRCTDAGTCDAGLGCLAGRCIDALKAPCGGCSDDTACHLPSGRCVAATGCEPCASPTLRVVDETSELTPLACGAGVVRCICAGPADPPAGRPGREPQLALVDGKAVAVSYDPVYGDLVTTLAPLADLNAQSSVVGDGLPANVSATDPGYRGGSFEPGPDRGERPSMLVTTEALHVVHQDRDLRKASYTRLDISGQPIAAMTLPVAGVAGRYSCITTDPATGWPVGLVFVSNDGGASKLVQVVASSATPTGPEDWTATTVLERQLPPARATPCEDTCGPLDVCVVAADGLERCASVFDSLSCTESCGPHEICASPEGSVESTCRPRVYRTPKGGDSAALPFGHGLFVACSQRGNQAVAAFYDRDVGALYALDWPWAGSVPVLVDGTPEVWDAPDVGAHVDVAIAPSGAAVGLSYWDATAGGLRFAERLGPAEPWVATSVHLGVTAGASTDLGAWTSSAYLPSGQPTVAYADSEGARILLAGRSATGCWKSMEVLSNAAYVTPDLAVTEDGRVVIAARELAFDAQLRAQHRLVLTTITPPSCTGN